MAVFVSYARPDESRAQRVAEALRAAGYEVWRDDELPAHRAYADVIEERLSAAKAVIVLWSSDAAKSQWVRAEADAARVAGTLIQVTRMGQSPRCRSTRSNARTCGSGRAKRWLRAGAS
jgi:adenylate cyclase